VPANGSASGSGTGAGTDNGMESLPRDRTRERERPCKCPPEKGGKKVRRNHSMNPEPRRYQARITGFAYGLVTDDKGRETNEGWNTEWDWLDIDFDGFQSSQCLLQEAKGNYDQFFKENGELKFPFNGFLRMQEQIATQGEVVRTNPPSKLMWYFETPRTRAYMMNTLRLAGVPSVYQP
ncbi:restriction endonuclease fold toxin 5 domain-containing protein, partial [Paraburkholderia tropica]|uniref:restriction endonuclease fold toxin 5 domain-containing protein n=2 Tax=Paraburkholderia tropica TaxID=92647 RepID=UPI002ABD1CA2